MHVITVGTRMQTHTHTCTHPHTYTHTHMQAHTDCCCGDAGGNSRDGWHPHTNTHTHTYTYLHTNTHKHAGSYGWQLWYAVVMHVAVGAIVAALCYMQHKESRSQFMKVLQCVAVCCSVLLCVAVWCSPLLHAAQGIPLSILEGVAVCCSML